MSDVERFLEKTAPATGGCVVWTAGTNGWYGAFYLNSKIQKAHRVAYELFVGPIPDGLVLDHLCRNTLCVNPAHLEPVAHQQNVVRGNGWAGRNARKTHCKSGHEFTEANTFTRPNGQRVCRECNRLAKVAERAAS